MTLDNWRWAQWAPRLIDRRRYHKWEDAGSKDMLARANDLVREILEQHEVPPVPDEAESMFEQVIAERAEQ